MEIEPIAHICTDFPEKFGVPRQSGLAKNLKGKIVFREKYRNPEALRGLEGFSHLWLIWEFSENRSSKGEWHPTVRPPRLGGNTHIGVFATRSPFRPNPLALSCVKLASVVTDSSEGPLIYVTGADLVDGTPIYDIKPYIKYADSHPDAICSYVDNLQERTLDVIFPEDLKSLIGESSIVSSLIEVLKLDPRPSYHNDPHREYGMAFAGYNVRFTVSGTISNVISVESLDTETNSGSF